MEEKVSLLGFLLAFSENLDDQVPEKRRHSSRVANISFFIADKLNLSEKEKYNLIISALLHDAGNGNNNFKNSSKEIDEHALKGSLFISDIPFLENISKIIKYHHIAWDFGKGNIYKEEPVPMESQILFLAEFIDHKLNKQKYILKEKNKIIKRVKEEGEKLFNKDVMEAFLSLSNKESFWFEVNYDTPSPEDFSCDLKLDIDGLLLLSKAVARIVDYRSKIQVRHSRNVTNVASYLSEKLGYDSEMIKKIKIAGYLHDIGKVALPPSILLKQEKLSKKDTDYIKIHPFKTYLTLKKGLPYEDITIWASYHHEKLNGKGYPFRVSGESIPIPARIITISDIYSALLENRPYRLGLSENKVLSYMKKLATEKYIDKEIFSIIIENKEEVSSVIKL